jgi:hypothetical protein
MEYASGMGPHERMMDNKSCKGRYALGCVVVEVYIYEPFMTA